MDHIILHALRKDPLKRYRSVHEFADDVGAILGGAAGAGPSRNGRTSGPEFLGSRKDPIAAGAGPCGGGFGRRCGSGNVGQVEARGVAFGECAQAAAATTGQKSIAVMPFESFGNNREEDYFVDGMQDNILTDLTKVSDLKVISRSGVEPYRHEKKDARAIGRALNVRYVLEGSLQKSGERLRINVRLVDTGTDAQIWSERYERTVADLFGLQSELAQAIVTQLKATLSPAEKAAIERRPTEDMEAYDLYLRARALMNDYYDMDAGGLPQDPGAARPGHDKGSEICAGILFCHGGECPPLSLQGTYPERLVEDQAGRGDGLGTRA